MGSLALCARDMNISLFFAGPGSHANAARAGYFGLLVAALIPGQKKLDFFTNVLM